MPRRIKKTNHPRYSLKINCEDKKRYKTQDLAKKAAEFCMLDNMNLNLSVYKCSDCGYWHLTKKRRGDNSSVI